MPQQLIESLTLGFFVIAVVVAVGFFVRKFNLLDENAEKALNKIAFNLTSPALYFYLIATADLELLFSNFLLSTVLGILITVLITVIGIWLCGVRNLKKFVLYSGATTFVNSSNIGVPIAVYLLGDSSYIAPIILLQALILSPLMLIILDLSHDQNSNWKSSLIKPLKNPVLIGTLLGILVLIFGQELNQKLLEPFELLGKSSIPILLLTLGVSIYGTRFLSDKAELKAIWFAVAVKTFVLPAITLLIGIYLIPVQPAELLALGFVAALPAGQTIYNYANEYRVLESTSRDLIFLTTLTSIPIILITAVIFSR